MNAQTKVEQSIVGALAKALPELEAAKKTKANPAFKSKYADLSAVIDALDPLRKHGIWFRQVQHDNEAGVLVETLYIHESGQELSAGHTFVPAVKKDAQGYGSAMSYARRYGLQSAFGLATEDDDGNAAAASMRRPAPVQTRAEEVPARKTKPLTGPIKTRGELRQACGALTRDLHGCSDADMLAIVLKDNKALIDQVQQEHEFYWNGDGADFLGLKGEIEAAKARIAMENMA